MACRERRKLDAPAGEERGGSNEECVGAVAHEGGEGRLDLLGRAGVEDLNLQSEGARRFRYVSQRGLGDRSVFACPPIATSERTALDVGFVPRADTSPPIHVGRATSAAL